MPAEQTGLVRENYAWKVMLRRGEGKDGEFSHVLDPIYDKQLFLITWGSTVSFQNFNFFPKNSNFLYSISSLPPSDHFSTKSQKFR